MWKKLLSLTLAASMFVSSTAFAVVVSPFDGGDLPESADGPILNFELKNTPFNPANGEEMTVNYELQVASDVVATVYYPCFTDTAYKAQNPGAECSQVLYSGLKAATAPGAYYSIIWDGETTTGDLLADGEYTVELEATPNPVDPLISAGRVGGTAEINKNPYTGAPVIENLEADPSTFSTDARETTSISFNVTESSKITVEVVESVAGGYETVKTFSSYTSVYYTDLGEHSIAWDGKSNNGSYVADGDYYVEVVTENSKGNDRELLEITIDNSADAQSGVIQDLELSPSKNWDPTDEELEIKFDVTQNVRSLYLYVESADGKVVEIADEGQYDADDYETEWDGTDDDGDYVDSGSWTLYILADGDEKKKNIDVSYERPTITEALVSKTEFDPTKGEEITLMFKVDTESVITVDVYDGSKKEFTLVDEEIVNKNRWYTATWDGIDEDGDEVEESKAWSFQIKAENPTEDTLYDSETVEFDVADDDVTSSKSNVTNDLVAPFIFDDSNDSTIEISYCMDEDADIFVAIYDGYSTSGSAEIELLDYDDQDNGCHTVTWNARDEDGKKLSDDIYSYKIISKRGGSKKDTETGRFVVGNAGTVNSDDEDDDDDTDDEDNTDSTCDDYYGDMYGVAGTEMCSAISWATENQIFGGYNDGTFRPYTPISRAEILKVVLESYNALLLPSNGGNLGFNDVDTYAWYMPYARTAQLYGMLNGYENGTEARMGNNISRVELLKFVLEASQSFNGLNLKNLYSGFADVDYSAWYAPYVGAAYMYDLYDVSQYGGQYYLNPGTLVQRGEVALMLYRLHTAGLL